LGSGFVEGVYAHALAIELRSVGLRVECEVPVSVYYRGVEVGRFRADQVVNGGVLVELKAADRLVKEHEQQVMNYLNATKLEVALLLNFGPRPTFKRFIFTNNNKKHL
jgi:GxxExxY protein